MASDSSYLEINSSSGIWIDPDENMDSSLVEQPIKIRKPYTITKQRERWTGEEQNKFIEALKLYGRAWHQIKEHIGSKSAIQIRSHAQKFFTKVFFSQFLCSWAVLPIIKYVMSFMVVRETDEVKSMAIPPPRPKKKPTKPYPRKLGSLPKIQITEKPEWPLIPKITSNQEEDKLSPTSTISAVESNAHCLSSGSAAVQISSSVSRLETFLNEKENEVKDNALGVHSFDMEVDLRSSIEPPVTSLKLFGMLVVIADSPKSLSSIMVAEQNNEPFPSNKNESNSSSLFFHLLPSYTTDIATTTRVYGLSDNFPQSSLDEECSINDDQNDDSITGSKCIELISSVVRPDETPIFKFNHSERSGFRILKVASERSTRGFAPYKR